MKYGFIGCGNMGGAVARALARETNNILVTDRSGKAAALAQELGIGYTDNETAASTCDVLFLCVKPQMMEAVLGKLQGILQAKKPLLVSMAAGLTMERISKLSGGSLPVMRIMPNTPVAVGKGLILCCRNDLAKEEAVSRVREDLRWAGLLEEIPEGLMDAGSALSGCGPAYVYVFLEALADGAVACGIPREKALRYAAATVAGAAEMVLATGKHPGALKDAVCSPGGSTIEGIRVLEQKGFRGAVMDCVSAACEKNKLLGK